MGISAFLHKEGVLFSVANEKLVNFCLNYFVLSISNFIGDMIVQLGYQKVSVINTANNTVIATILVGNVPWGVAVGNICM
jgi:YVTN family beta-propeller protein